MIPDRVSLVSFNLWNTQRWPEREPALRDFLTTFNPDILCLQEVRIETLDCISDTLKTHQCVDDKFAGWRCESNIFWNSDYFSLVEYGHEALSGLNVNRGLFWARLKLAGASRTLFVATAHFTWQGTDEEIKSGYSPRNKQARQTIELLEKRVHEDEASFFMGDLNDPLMPSILFPKAGYESCFSALGLLSPPTCPAIPTCSDIGENQVLDWIFSNQQARTLSACVPQNYVNDLSASDHWPVHAVYQL